MLIKKINMSNTRWICMIQYTGVLRIIAYLIQNYKVSSMYLLSTIRTFSFEDDLFGTSTKIPMKTNYFQLTRLIKSFKSQVTHRSQVSCSSSLSYDKLVYTIQHSQNNLHLQHQNQSRKKLTTHPNEESSQVCFSLAFDSDHTVYWKRKHI